jgi:hypothetical protein
VYTWSADKVFLQALHSLIVTGEKNWVAQVPLLTLPPGKYTAEASLTTTPAKLYSATAAFTIDGPQPAQ